MTYIAKAALFCDRCGARLDVDPERGEPRLMSAIATEGTPLEGWIRLDGGHHLCPVCAKEYEAKRAEMERELKRFAGIKEISFDL